MPQDTGSHSLTLGGAPSEIGRAAEWLAGLGAGGLFSPTLLYEIHLCLEETLANIVLHGMGATAEPRIDISLTQQPGRLILVVEDNGVPFDPSLAAAPALPAALDDAATGGQGIRLMRQFSDTMSYAHVDGRNRLTFAFDSAHTG